jgi:hypothetical protein
MMESDADWRKIFTNLAPYTSIMHLKNTPQPDTIHQFNPFRHVFEPELDLHLPLLSDGFINYDEVLEKVGDFPQIEWVLLEWFGNCNEEIIPGEIAYLREHTRETKSVP